MNVVIKNFDFDSMDKMVELIIRAHAVAEMAGDFMAMNLEDVEFTSVDIKELIEKANRMLDRKDLESGRHDQPIELTVEMNESTGEFTNLYVWWKED